jgi:hypothetical protein
VVKIKDDGRHGLDTEGIKLNIKLQQLGLLLRDVISYLIISGVFSIIFSGVITDILLDIGLNLSIAWTSMWYLLIIVKTFNIILDVVAIFFNQKFFIKEGGKDDGLQI